MPLRHAPARFAASLLDATVAGSFTRLGFRVRQRTWAELPSLAGRSYLVTGANSGIGLAAVEGLARLGASVRLVCRDRGRAESTLAALARRFPAARLRLDILDVSNLSEVGAYAAGLLREGEPLHGLVHNAGVMLPRRTETSEGKEATLATNVLGPFALTRALLPTLSATRPKARVVFVSSGGMIPVGLRLDDLQWTRRAWDGVRAYAESKRAEVVLAREFAARHADAASFHSMHPGWVDTPALRNALPRFHRFWRPWLRTPAEGADTIVWLLATEEAIGSGRFWFDRLPRRTHVPWRGDPVPSAQAERLWSECERLSHPEESG